MWKNVQKVRVPLARHELQISFSYECPQGTMDTGRALRLAKECKKLIEPPYLTPSVIEIMFAKVINHLHVI
jgi:hypothetical protein